jgi:methylmalonyl-CoA mutase cobalamin-binding domain/chain
LLESAERTSGDHDAVDAVSRLRALGLLDVPDDESSVSLHRLLATFVREVSPDSTARSAAESTLRVRAMARALADAGAEAIYLGTLRGFDPVLQAVNQGVDAICVTIVSGAQMIIFPRLIEDLRRRARHIRLIADGPIPYGDAAKLRWKGIAAIVGREATPYESAKKVLAAIENRDRRIIRILVGRAGPEMWN